MNRIFYPTSNVILFRLSDNAEHYRGGEGTFRVSYQKALSKNFPTLLEAFFFYMTIEEEAELWNVTDSEVLIESKVQLHLN
ncbi:MAG: hypothetical protein M3Y85_07770 [Bacteroidota bacterium]|nr:hypothetical protein [Bacteroidota bacterium]